MSISDIEKALADLNKEILELREEIEKLKQTRPHWYSVCSAHCVYDSMCEMCISGQYYPSPKQP